MKHLKSKNIFSSFSIHRNSQSVSNICKYHGTRIIDLFINFPVNFVKNNLIPKIDLNYINKNISIDLQVIGYIDRFNRRSPFKVICEDNFNNKVLIIYFNLYAAQIKKFLILGNTYRITGKLECINKNFQIIHPSNVLNKFNISEYETIYPEYNLSRKRINKKIYRKIILKNLSSLQTTILPDEWIEKKF